MWLLFILLIPTGILGACVESIYAGRFRT